MTVVGSSGAARRGRLTALAVSAFLLGVVVTAGVSDAATVRAKGIDVSNWNGSIRWARVAAAGYSFAFGKASEGTSYVDPTYATNRNGSEGAGLVFGAYHFARPSGGSTATATASAIAQADHFLAVADPLASELPPVLDLEATGGLGPRRLRIWARAWVSEIEARLGVQPFVYSSPAFWQKYLGDSPKIAAAGARLWIAHWTSAGDPWVPAKNWNGQGWTFWQWTNCVVVPGIAHCVDGDRMNGAHPTDVAIQPYPTGAPVLATAPTLLGPPEATKLLAALPGSWQGGKPLAFSYQWKRCDAAGLNCVQITGATDETYRAAKVDVGHSLKVVVLATSPDGFAKAASVATVAVTKAGTPPVGRPANVNPPRILGQAQVGEALTSTVGTWSGAPSKFAYRWLRCDTTGASCLAIPHATLPAYTVKPPDIGSTLVLVVTATGAGGAGTAQSLASHIVIAAPLPPVSVGSQTVVEGVAGNVQTEDGGATVTWQPGAVPVGLTVSLGTFDEPLAIAGSEVALTVPDLPSRGFSWPLDIAYAEALPADAVLGYSTDGTVFRPVPALNPPQLAPGAFVGSYVDANGLTHVLTKTPLELAEFERGAWGDPTYTSQAGPTLTQQTEVHTLHWRGRHAVLVLTRLTVASQVRLTATLRHRGRRIAVFSGGSRLGPRLQPGHVLKALHAEKDRPGLVRVRLHLNGWHFRRGRYVLRVEAVDPWGRISSMRLPFTYSG